MTAPAANNEYEGNKMSSMSSPDGNRDGGESGEAASAAFITDVLGGDLVYQHTPGEAPQGIDLSYLHDDELHVAEVKSVLGDWHQPYTAQTVDGRQMDVDWVADRLERTGVEIDPSDVGDEEGQVRTDLFQVDYPGDTIARYHLESDGSKTDTSPEEIWPLSDVIDVHESIDEAEPDLGEALDSASPPEGEAPTPG